MQTKQVKLTDEWNLIFHKKYTLFVDTEAQNKYSIIDGENDHVGMFTVNESSIEFHHSVYNLQHKVDFSTRTIEIKHQPYDEEGE